MGQQLDGDGAMAFTDRSLQAVFDHQAAGFAGMGLCGGFCIVKILANLPHFSAQRFHAFHFQWVGVDRRINDQRYAVYPARVRNRLPPVARAGAHQRARVPQTVHLSGHRRRGRLIGGCRATAHKAHA